MILNDANEIAKILQIIAGENLFLVIGGRTALIHQNILKEDRPIGDLDMNIIMPPNKSFPLSHVISNFSKVRRCLRDYYKNYDIVVDIGSLKSSPYQEDEEEEEEAYYGKDPDAQYEKKENTDDSLLSVTITMRAKIVAPVEVKPPGMIDKPYEYARELLERELRNAWISRSYIGNTSVTSSMPGDLSSLQGNVTSSYDPYPPSVNTWETPLRSYSPPEEEVPTISDSDVEDWIIEQNIIKLGQIVLNNGGNVKLDLFPLQTDFPTNKIKTIDGQFFVSPYIILKAKYKYCINPKTNMRMYIKHLMDLEKSFESIHIKGVNYPEDLEFLRTIQFQREIVT